MRSFLSSNSSVETSPDLQNELMSAVLDRDIERIRQCLKQGANPAQALDESSPTALHQASELGIVDIAKCLVKHNRHVFNKKEELPVLFNPAGFTVLQVAGTDDMARFWISECPALLEARSRSGHRTPLMIAVEEGDYDRVELLLEGHTLRRMKRHPLSTEAVNAVNSDGYSALHMAAFENESSIAHLLLSHKADVTMGTRDRHTALSIACGHRDFSTALSIILYIDQRSDKEKLYSKIFATDKRNPLHWACMKGNGRVVEDLFHNIPFRFLEPHVNYGLVMTCRLFPDHEDIFTIQVLVESMNASVHFADKWGETPMHKACSKGSVTLVEWLWNYIRNTQEQQEDSSRPQKWEYDDEQRQPVWTRLTGTGQTPLMLAAENDHVEVCEFILRHSPSSYVDYENEQHDTALSLACSTKAMQTALFLVKEAGAQVYLSDEHPSFRNCVEVAQAHNNTQLARTLQCYVAQNLWNLLHYINKEVPHIWMAQR